MAKRMLIDATQPEETRVAVVSGNRLEEYDFETASKKQLKGNIYLAKVVRVEPSLQAAFVEYGGNRHGFLAFSEIHPDYYRIPVEDRAALIAEEREMAHDEERMDAMGLDAEASSAAVGRPATRPETGGSAVSQILPSEGAEAGADDAGAAEEAGTEAAAPESGEHDFIEHDGGDGAPEHEAGDHETREPAFAAEPEANQEAAAEPEGGEGETAPEAPRDGAPEDVSEAQPEAPQQVTTAESVENVGGEEVEVEVPRRRHPSRRYKIQEVIKRRQVMLVQVTKEERGTKGAALTTRLSLAGRYCVLMPNTGRGGGISRKITNIQDRKRLREIVDAIEIPEGISVIVRTAGAKRTKAEIKRDFDYLLRLWSDIRDRTLQSSAPALIYEEANLIKRSIRDLYARDMDDILVEGEEGYKLAKEFMRTLMPSHAKRVQPYRSPTVPLFQKFQIESQIAAIHEPLTRLKSGGYIVINQTEALVAIDVNSGRATRERNIEETATQTNLEASDEIARQLRMRDLAGLIVIDFIDMEHERNRRSVEKRLKDALKNDRARIQLGHISHFGLLEMSRQRLRPSLHEFSTERCPHCQGSGVVRSTESTALQVLRAVEEEGLKRRSAEIAVFAPPKVALYILNQKRPMLTGIESRHLFHVLINQDEALVPPDFRIEVMRTRTPAEIAAAEAAAREAPEPEFAPEPEPEIEIEEEEIEEAEEGAAQPEPAPEGRRRRGRGGRGGEPRHAPPAPQQIRPAAPAPAAPLVSPVEGVAAGMEGAGAEDQRPRKRRRRGKRGGRRRHGRGAPGTGGEPHTGGPAALEAPMPAEDDGEFEAPMPAEDDAEFEAPMPAEDDGEFEAPMRPGDQAAFEAAVHAAESAKEGPAEREPSGEPREGGEGRRRRRRRRGRGANGARESEPGSVPAAAEPRHEPTASAENFVSREPAPRPEHHEHREHRPHEPSAPPAAVESHGKSHAEEPDDRPKRRGWWQRLVE